MAIRWRQHYRRSGRAKPIHPLPPIDAHPIKREPLVYKPEYDAKKKALTVVDDPTLECLLPGVPRIQTEPMPLEIVQTPKEVVILYESFRAWRRIPINAETRTSRRSDAHLDGAIL